MDIRPLENLGLTTNEARIYVALSSSGRMSAGTLAKKVDMHRSRTYESLNRLIKKGIVHYVLLNKVHYYEALEPEKLLDVLDDRKEEISALIPQLKLLNSKPESVQRVSAFQGVGGIKSLLRETLNTNEYVVFGAPERSIELLSSSFWKNYNLKLNANKINTRMIFDDSLRDWSLEVKKINPKTRIKFLEQHFANLTETFVFDDKVIIITWSDEPMGVLMVDKMVADSYKQFFEMLWKQAK